MKKTETSFKEQQRKALEILEKEVRPQVEHYEKLQQEKSSSKTLILNPAQKAHMSCTHQL